ncbi:putative carboxypeptidase S1 [Rhizodiscina lignyota]|uniref:Carboxypeptidase S1 n=1 Tax=Rhizodiscina lignyota TaxID=1504668 RepID=A0A9P4MBE9_9PEZI|nr:putative carboxypeptidase S1 [Rhizodiscina lignyota]
MIFSILLSAALFHVSLAVYSDYFPLPAEGATVLHSKHDPDITLSYKKTDICESSYSGYVHLPASALSDVEGPPEYSMNTFFWFFPARESPETAPLAIWVDGGPGVAALSGAMTENGPCFVNDDGNSTRRNPFSRNNRVNMLYIDQPISAGYSYSNLVNITYNLLTETQTPTDFSKGIPFTPNITVFPGTVSNPDLAFTANNSNIAAKAMWHFAQVWFEEFPIYHPENERISLWTNSYGGYFGLAIFSFWESQNKKIQSGDLKAHYLHLDTLGIENGCIDAVSQALGYPHIAYNNTYNFPLINETVYNEIVQSVIDPDPDHGCLAAIHRCREVASVGDPQFYANNKTVNDICAVATELCFPILGIAETYANRSSFDIAQVLPTSFPNYQHSAFFNRRWVQQSLGAPVNYTDSANLTGLYFLGTADAFRQSQASVEYLLQNDVQVTLVYGDRDTRCNWIGVENISLTVDYPDAKNFRAAGYADIHTNKSYTGGVVRQYDGFSFSRVFEAGHEVSAFQPETAYEIFNRAMFRHDIATGTRGKYGASHYQSKGPASSWSIKNVLPPPPPPKCDLWAMSVTCTDDQIIAIENGTAIFDGVIVTSPAS